MQGPAALHVHCTVVLPWTCKRIIKHTPSLHRSFCRGLQRFMSTAVLYFCNLLVGLSVMVNLMVRTRMLLYV